MAHLHPSSARHSLAELAVCGLRLMSELYKNPSKSGKDPQSHAWSPFCSHLANRLVESVELDLKVGSKEEIMGLKSWEYYF